MPDEHTSELGTIEVHKNVMSAIAGYETARVEGVAGMSEGVADGIAKKLTGDTAGRGVRVTLDDNGRVTIDLSIIVRYGTVIPEVCRKVQEAVLSALRRMTASSVVAVNVYVQGVELPQRAQTTAETEMEGWQQ
jgi:uncharacterized alkaline shock family protein YloU